MSSIVAIYFLGEATKFDGVCFTIEKLFMFKVSLGDMSFMQLNE